MSMNRTYLGYLDNTRSKFSDFQQYSSLLLGVPSILCFSQKTISRYFMLQFVLGLMEIAPITIYLLSSINVASQDYIILINNGVSQATIY